MQPKIYVIEGFDDIGKDWLFDRLKAIVTNNPKYSWFNDRYEFYKPTIDRTKLPDYRKDPAKFQLWLFEHTQKEVQEINEILSSGKNVIIVRFLLTDLVYAEMFDRPNIVKCILDNEITLVNNIENFIMLWKSYDDYLERVKKINPDLPISDIEYDSDEFEEIQYIFKDKSTEYSKRNMIVTIDSFTSDTWIINEFMKFIMDNLNFC